MKIYYPNLEFFFHDNPSIHEVSEKLFQLGHENEVIEDRILDIDFTPNRGDCLSLKGIARDLNIFYKSNLEVDIYKDDLDHLNLNFINNAKNECPNISFLMIEIEGEIKTYKNYIDSYFKALDIKKNNFFTDVSNYLAYETGQPTHCYDLDKINGSIALENALNAKENIFQTVTDQKIKLIGNNLVFTNDNKIINLAGVMGGRSVSCTNETKRVLIECAYFLPESIIGKSLIYDLQSEAAFKFERGVDSTHQENILRRFISIVSQHASIKSMAMKSYRKEDYKPKIIKSSHRKICSILGHEISCKQYQEYLEGLGFKITKESVQVPSYRNDIQSQNDIAEEIARIIGYNNIKSKPFNLPKKTNYLTFAEDKIKALLVGNGFNEVINQSFVSSKTNIKVDNPIDSNKSYLRDSIKDSLIDNLIYNERRQKDSIKLFEISDTYDKSEDYTSKKKLSLIVSGRVGKDYLNFSKMLDKDFVLNIFKQYSLEIDSLQIMEIDRSLLQSKNKSKIYALELDLDKFDGIDFRELEKLQPLEFESCPKYKDVSEFPVIKRDLSFMLTDSSVLQDMENTILSLESKYLKEAFVFDYFYNHKTGDTKLGFRFIFQSNSKTLTINDIENVIQEIIKKGLGFNGVTLPGL